MNDTNKQITIVTGMSGAGKTVALQTLEDLGYYCVDNLPPMLIPRFVEMTDTTEINKIALGIDLRARDFFDEVHPILEQLSQQTSILLSVIYLEASDEVLVSRYKETRRSHPLAPTSNITEGIELEKRLLANVKHFSQHIYDTSSLKPRDLKNKIISDFTTTQSTPFSITVMSFGFKHHVPIDADLVFDVRFLPNPFYVSELRMLTGLNDDVYHYVMNFETTQKFYHKLLDLVNFMLPEFQKEGRSQVIIAIGCTGGQHRSVSLARKLTTDLSKNYTVYSHHRDAKVGDRV